MPQSREGNVHKVVFTGFDSAWGRRNKGALCHLALRRDGALEFIAPPDTSAWNDATAWARRATWESHVVAIDQGLVVRDATGMRPVERKLAKALMKDFKCGAHASNTSNPCYGPAAGIWDFVEVLEGGGYQQTPMAIAERAAGSFYFECFPHPALLGLFDLDGILKYKVRHRDPFSWQQLLELLRSLEVREPPLLGIGCYAAAGLPQTLDNENKLDAIIAAYVGAFWWHHGTDRSVSLGSLSTGYVVTPFSERTKAALDSVFAPAEMNVAGRAASARPATTSGAVAGPSTTSASIGRAPTDPVGAAGCRQGGEVELVCTDPGNLQGNVNPWMTEFEGVSLVLAVLDAEGEPTIRFVPYRRFGAEQKGM